MDTESGAPYQGAPHSRLDWDLSSLRHWSHTLAGDVVAPAIRARAPPQSLPTRTPSDNNHSFRRRHGGVRRLARAHPDAPHVPTDRKTLRRINQPVRDIERDPFGGIGKPEPLRHEYSGLWSRRIDQANRLVYEVATTPTIVIYSCRDRYAR